ncbi:hypothetical protein M5E88_07735 [Akkermansia muciniphila]|nr:hypothetical protein M5E88_07735 [Akkermansia muciniphila]
MTTQLIPVPTRDWKVVSGERSAAAPELAIDGDSSTLWHTHAAQGELAPRRRWRLTWGVRLTLPPLFTRRAGIRQRERLTVMPSI